MKYRAEIDGIRFFSILFVILYHLKFPYFVNFGFLGVDIFFVISGYLIATILLEEKSNTKKINLLHFIERRLRRIVPAIIFLIIIVYALNIFFFYNYPKIFELNLSQIIKTILFISNEMRTNYFEPSRDFKILYHTWSLSLEMQVYLLFSIFFIFFIKLREKIQIIFIISIMTVCGLLSQSGANFKINYPFIEKEFFLYNQPYWAGFFSIIPRLFEFLTGVLCAYYLNNNIKLINDTNNFYKNFFSFFGIFLIFLSFSYFKETSFHPSILTLPLLFGVSLVIIFCINNTFFYSFLSWKPIAHVGKLSYSAYLYHVPIIFFFNFYFHNIDIYLKTIIVLLLTYCFSYFSYNFIEKFFRSKKVKSSNFFIMILAFYFVIFCSTYYIKNNKNYILNKEIKRVKDFNSIKDKYFRKKIGIETELFGEPIKLPFSSFNAIKNEKILIIGNSIATDFFLMFELNKKIFQDYDFKYFRFQLSNFIQNNDKRIKRINYFLDSDLFRKSEVIVIASNFRKYGRYSEDIESLEHIYKITKKFNKKLVLISNPPQFESIFSPVEDILFKYKSNELNKEFLNKELFGLINKKEYGKNTILRNFASKKNIKFLDVSEYLCDWNLKKCDALDKNDNILHSDLYHLTVEGADYFGKKIHKMGWFNIN